MSGTALLMWIVTMAGGAVLLVLWLVHGGAKRPADTDPTATGGVQQTATMTRTRSRIPLSVIVPHASLAVVGAISWALYSANKGDTAYSPARWFSVAVLLATIALGLAMFRPWLADRRSGDSEAREHPEQRLPAVVVLLHGLAAAATLVLVLLAVLA